MELAWAPAVWSWWMWKKPPSVTTVSSTTPISRPPTASPMTAQPTSVPTMASSTETFGSSSRAIATAWAISEASLTFETP